MPDSDLELLDYATENLGEEKLWILSYRRSYDYYGLLRKLNFIAKAGSIL